jgi:bifunctional DNase/RNase
MIEMTIDSIGISPMSYQRVVFLKEKAANRYLPVWIGPAEADAIAIKLQGLDIPRPLSHDLLWSVISSLGASVDSVIINDLRDDTFYGRIILNAGEGQVEIDARPSDALALAIRAEAPIFAEDAVLDEAALLIDRETGKAIPHEMTEGGNVSEDELRRLSTFTDFINTLDMDDFGEGRQEK